MAKVRATTRGKAAGNVLYWVYGAVPSSKDEEEAVRIESENPGVQVRFRNAKFDNGNLRKCIGVAGCAPKRYVNEFGWFKDTPHKTNEESVADRNADMPPSTPIPQKQAQVVYVQQLPEQQPAQVPVPTAPPDPQPTATADKDESKTAKAS